MANTTATLYIRSKAGLSKAPKKPADLPEGSTYYIYWYEDGTKRTVECPVLFEPVSMRETVIQGANDGTTEEAYGGAGG